MSLYYNGFRGFRNRFVETHHNLVNDLSESFAPVAGMEAPATTTASARQETTITATSVKEYDAEDDDGLEPVPYDLVFFGIIKPTMIWNQSLSAYEWY